MCVGVAAVPTRRTSLLRQRRADRVYDSRMNYIQTLRISAKVLSVFWGALGVFWSCRFLALYPDDTAYKVLPLTAACFAAAVVLLCAGRFLPHATPRRTRRNGWTTRFMEWADDL